MSGITKEARGREQETAEGRQIWLLPAQLGHRQLAAMAKQLLSVSPATLVIDVRKFRQAHPGADAHLLDVLTLAKRHRAGVELLVNRTSIRGSDAVAIRQVESLTRTLAGILLVGSADAVRDQRGGDHTDELLSEVDAALAEAGGVVWRGLERAAPVYPEARLTSAALVVADDPKDVRSELHDELTRLGVTLPEDLEFWVSTCVHQAVENVRLHAGRQLPRGQRSALGFLLLRRIRTGDVSRLAKASAPPMSEYYARHLRSGSHHIEVTVADNGGGIAATLAGSRRVYTAATDLALELEHLNRALSGGSRIRSSNAGRGLGFPQMVEAVARTGGLMIIRSGRLRVHIEATLESRGPRMRPAVRERLRSPRELPYPIGTTIVFVFPEPSRRRR